MVQPTDIVGQLAEHRLSAQCFSRYVKWILRKDPEKWSSYDLMRMLIEGDQERLSNVEHRLQEAQGILGLSDRDFSTAFGFTDDLLSDDPERLHDVLAEPMFAVDLADLGFTGIQKLPASIRTGGDRIRNADFLGMSGASKFAIELKTIRMENRPAPVTGRPLGDSMKPYWWGEMFRNNAIAKIEDKNKRVLEQLKNAKAHYRCERTMLALYTRRLGPSALMTHDDYVAELSALHGTYPEIDHWACKDYFGHVAIVPEI